VVVNSYAFKLIASLVVITSLAACDPAYPLFLRNGLPEAVEVHAKFEGEPLREALLRPGQRMAFLHPEGDIEQVIVTLNGRKLYDLNKAGLLTMLESVSDPRQVTWNIQSDGIKPLSSEALENLDRK
jgi:hypothetical protein